MNLRSRACRCFLILTSLFLADYCAIFPFTAIAESKETVAASSQTYRWDFKTQADKHYLEFWRPVTGEWELAAEPEHPANQVLRQSENGPRLAMLATRQPLCNFEFTVRLRTDTFATSSRNWQLGFVFRRQDAAHYYKLRLTSANLALIKQTPPRPGSVPSSIGHTRTATADRPRTEGQLLCFQPLSLPKDSWHTLGVRCLGETLTMLWDGKELQSIADCGIGSGQLVLFSVNTPALFDDLQLAFRPVPKLASRLAVEPKIFTPFRGGEVLIYFQLERDGPVTVRVLDPAGKVFNVLTKEVHSVGINSIAWDGQGLTASNPVSGLYLIEVAWGEKPQRIQVHIQNGAGAGGGTL